MKSGKLGAYLNSLLIAKVFLFLFSGNTSLHSTCLSSFKGGQLIYFISLHFKPHSIFINDSWSPVVCANSISRWFKMTGFYFKTGYFVNLFCTGYSFLYPLPFLRHYKFRKVFTAPIGDHSRFSPVNIILVAISVPCKCSQSNYVQIICGFPYREQFLQVSSLNFITENGREEQWIFW